MARLLLMRHAKSSWASDTATDHERPLNNRGRRDAPGMADRIAAAGWGPDVALVSDAARTEETWAWMADRFPDTRSELLPSLYHGRLEDILAAVATQGDDGSTILALGHNPGWEDAIGRLSGRSVTLKTAMVGLLEHAAPMGEAITRRDWTLAGLLAPS